jgi:hypothetical protein
MTTQKIPDSLIINGIKYINIEKVALLINKSIRTIRLWDKLSLSNECENRPRFIPKSIQVNNVYYFKESDLSEIRKFSICNHYGLRNYLFLEASNGSDDLGSLEIGWDLDTSWDKIILNGRAAFRNLYRINYLLYRAEYVALRGHKKRM